MKLTINNTQEYWLDKVEWLQYEPRREFGDSCGGMDLINETICYADIGTHATAEFLQMEWAYKLINHSIDKVQLGVINEYQNFIDALQCFPCG